jgi:hypothetical protein
MEWHGHDCGYTGSGRIFRNGVMHDNIAKPWLWRCGSCGYISGGCIFRSGGMHANISGWGYQIMWVANQFWKNFKTQLDPPLNKAQHKQELLSGKIFGSGRNVYVIDEPSIFIQLRSISKLRFNKINTNSDITPPNNLDMVTFEILLAWDFVSTKA